MISKLAKFIIKYHLTIILLVGLLSGTYSNEDAEEEAYTQGLSSASKGKSLKRSASFVINDEEEEDGLEPTLKASGTLKKVKKGLTREKPLQKSSLGNKEIKSLKRAADFAFVRDEEEEVSLPKSSSSKAMTTMRRQESLAINLSSQQSGTDYASPSGSVTGVEISLPVVESAAEAQNPRELDSETVRTLRALGADERTIALARIAQSCLYKEMRKDLLVSPGDARLPQEPKDGSLKIDFSALSPMKVQQFKNLGGTQEEIERQVLQMKTEHPSPIRRPEFMGGHLHSPAARAAMQDRRLVDRARKSGVVKRLPFTAHSVPHILLTPQQREEQEIERKRNFLGREKERGKSAEDIERELQRERLLFKPYLDYVDMRKRQCGGDDFVVEANSDEEFEDRQDIDQVDDLEIPGVSDGLGPNDSGEDVLEVEKELRGKISKSELENKFVEFLSSQLSYIYVKGYDLYFSLETLDLERVQSSLDTNSTVMEVLGKSPIGADGKPMNFHHLTHYDFNTHKTKSIIVLLTESIHQEFSGLWHFGSKTFRLPRKRVIRRLFDPARKDFSKAIVKHLKESKSSLLK